MQYIQIDVVPSAAVLALGVALVLLLRALPPIARRAVVARTRRALERALDDE